MNAISSFSSCFPVAQLLAPQENQVKDDKLLWELLKKKQTRQQPLSPFGAKELLQVGSSTRHHQPMTGNPSIAHRPTTRAYGKLNTHSLGSLLPLGSSPSVTRSQVSSRKSMVAECFAIRWSVVTPGGGYEALPLIPCIDDVWRLREAFTTRNDGTCGDRIHLGVPESYEISSFMDSVKSPEISQQEAYALTELPSGESRDIHRRLSFPAGSRDVHQPLTFPIARRDDRDNRNGPGKDFRREVQKVINMVNVHSSKKKKRKDREATESWMNTPISFPPIMTDDASDEPLIIEAEVEGLSRFKAASMWTRSHLWCLVRNLLSYLPEKVKAGLRGN
ncbi:hypothetical protein Tco_0970954 [Tanacetum coccineum]